MPGDHLDSSTFTHKYLIQRQGIKPKFEIWNLIILTVKFAKSRQLAVPRTARSEKFIPAHCVPPRRRPECEPRRGCRPVPETPGVPLTTHARRPAQRAARRSSPRCHPQPPPTHPPRRPPMTSLYQEQLQQTPADRPRQPPRHHPAPAPARRRDPPAAHDRRARRATAPTARGQGQDAARGETPPGTAARPGSC